MNFLSKKKPSSLILAVLLLTIMGTSCQTLGMANPFSSGKDDFDRAKREWNNGNAAEALRYGSVAIYYDEKHWGAYKFIVANYDEAISQVEAKLAALDAQEQNLDTIVEKVDTLRTMSDFVSYVSGFPGEETDPKIVEFGRNSVAIPLTDYDTPLAEARAQGYTIAFENATAHIGKEAYDEAVESLGVITRRFVSNSEERQAAVIEIANFLADAAAPLVARLSINNLEGATTLMVAALKFEETEKVTALSEELNSKAVGIIFSEADRLARRGNLDAYVEALTVAVKARNYVEDNDEVNPKIYSFAQQLADRYKQDVASAVRGFDGTSEKKWEIENKYVGYVSFVDGWPSVSGHEDAIENFAAFIESSRTVVHVVLEPSQRSFHTRVSAAMDTALADQRGKVMWMYTDEKYDIAGKRAQYFRGQGRWWSNNRDKAESLIYPDSATRYREQVNQLTTESSLNEAKAFNIDYLVKITVDASSGNPRSQQRNQVQEVSAYQTKDGTVHTDSDTINALKAALVLVNATDSDAGRQAFQRQLDEKEITDYWFDVDITNTYQFFTATVTANYKVEVVRVSDGRSIHSSTFVQRDDVKSNEVLVGVRSAVPAIEGYFRQNVKEPASSFQPNTGSVVNSGFSQFNPAQAANAIRRD